MRKWMSVLFCLFLLIHKGAGQTFAGEKDDAIADLFTRQLMADPQEKIYVQTDKAFYLSGEIVWFAATVVDAVFHEPVTDDRYLFVELRTPLDSVVSHIVVRPDSLHGFYGHIPLEADLAEGSYFLVAYRNTKIDPEYFFKRTVTVTNPVSAILIPECKFQENAKDYLVELTFVNPQTKEKLQPEQVSMQVNGGKMNLIAFQEDTVGRFSFRKSKTDFPVLTLHMDYQKKKYRKYVPLSVAGDDYDVSFFPEGGQLISGEPAVVAFKAINLYGLSEAVTGFIEDGEGAVMQTFETTHKGMGKFLLRPEPGKTYYAVCKNNSLKEKRFKLPEAQTGNFSLQVTRQQKWVSISVVGLGQSPNDPQLSLFIHTKGLPLYHQKWNSKRNLLLIEQDSLPSGISHLLLLNDNNDVISERLVFNRNRQDEVVAHLATDADRYDKRSLISSKISLSDNHGSPLLGKFAVSVTDDKYATTDSAIHILSTLLLTSELKGHIEEPAGYFRDEESEMAVAVDLLMMTQGWRRYNIPEIIKGQIETPDSEGMNDRMITGKVERLFRAMKDATVSLIVNTPTSSEWKETKTDKNGRFTFDQLTYPDSTYLVVQAADKKDRDKIHLAVNQPQKFEYKTSNHSLFTTKREVDLHEYTVVADKKYVNEHGMRTYALPEVTVKAKRYIPKSVFYSPINVNHVITSEDIEKVNYGTLEQLLIHLPEVNSIRRRDYIVYVYARGVSVARLIVNDYVVSGFQFFNVGLDMIESIFVLKEDHLNGGGPSIVITLKKEGWGGKSQPPQNIRKIDWIGYQQPVEFYSPKYETTEEKNAVHEDLRTTLYWHPSIRTNEDGEARFDFYSADASTTYSVIIEGVTNDGKIIRHISNINRK